MKCVAVSQRVDALLERQEVRDALDQRLVMFIAAAGGLAVPVPNGLASTDNLNVWLSCIQPDALVLSGGSDIGLHPERDLTEDVLLAYAESRNLPVLGICRGMQMMAHRAGVELEPVQGHVRKRHQLVGAITREVNSYHDFALVSCPETYDVLARSSDSVIEAIRHQTLPWEGWMWHPEREHEFHDEDLTRASMLLDTRSSQTSAKLS